jgi:hypothetical protein
MKTSRYSPQQIAMALRQAKAGTPTEAILSRPVGERPRLHRRK